MNRFGPSQRLNLNIHFLCDHGLSFDRFRFDDLFGHILRSYDLTYTEYVHWRSSLMSLTLTSSDHALYPLLHFVLDDLPTSTRSPQLDDANTRFACENDKTYITNGSGGNGALL